MVLTSSCGAFGTAGGKSAVRRGAPVGDVAASSASGDDSRAPRSTAPPALAAGAAPFAPAAPSPSAGAVPSPEK